MASNRRPFNRNVSEAVGNAENADGDGPPSTRPVTFRDRYEVIAAASSSNTRT